MGQYEKVSQASLFAPRGSIVGAKRVSYIAWDERVAQQELTRVYVQRRAQSKWGTEERAKQSAH